MSKKLVKSKTSSPEIPSNPPVNLVVPNTIEKKMEAIVNLSQAIADCAKALNSIHLQATIMNNVINNSDTGIHIQS